MCIYFVKTMKHIVIIPLFVYNNINPLTHCPWWRFTNPLQVIAARCIVPRHEGVVFGIHSCAVLIVDVVRLSSIPKPAANDTFFIILLSHSFYSFYSGQKPKQENLLSSQFSVIAFFWMQLLPLIQPQTINPFPNSFLFCISQSDPVAILVKGPRGVLITSYQLIHCQLTTEKIHTDFTARK